MTVTSGACVEFGQGKPLFCTTNTWSSGVLRDVNYLGLIVALPPPVSVSLYQALGPKVACLVISSSASLLAYSNLHSR